MQQGNNEERCRRLLDAQQHTVGKVNTQLFAALFLTTGLGVIIFVGLSILSDWLLRHWHESAIKEDW